jgi:superfamily II DNA or RNA helicase
MTGPIATPTPIVTRPYQDEYIRQCVEMAKKGIRKFILQLETGGGKTLVAGKVMERCVAKGHRALFLAPARELVTQTSRKIGDLGLCHGVIMAGRGYHLHEHIQVCSTPTLLSRVLRRKNLPLPPADLVVIDEADLCGKETAKLLGLYPRAVIIGMTATPCKTNGRGLGGPKGYQGIVQASQRSELIRGGYITKTKVYAPYRPDMALTPEEKKRREKATGTDGDYRPEYSSRRMDRPELVGDIVTQYKRLGQDRPFIFFGCTVDHAAHVATRFRLSGIPCAFMDAQTPEDKRQEIFRGIEAGTVRGLANYGVCVAGIDLPCVGVIIMGRPTKSFRVYKQAIGRAVRPYSGPLYVKDSAILIDHSGCWEIFGLPDQDITWTLDPDKKVDDALKKNEPGNPRSVCCPKCHAVFESAPVCPACGHKMERQRRIGEIRENKNGILVEIPDGAPGGMSIQREGLVRLWRKCLAQAAARDAPVLVAAIIYARETGGRKPDEVDGMPDVPRTNEQWHRKTREMYPGYHGGGR